MTGVLDLLIKKDGCLAERGPVDRRGTAYQRGTMCPESDFLPDPQPLKPWPVEQALEGLGFWAIPGQLEV
jgi:hypothetical protein